MPDATEQRERAAVIRQSVSELSGHDAVGRAFILQYRNILDHAAR